MFFINCVKAINATHPTSIGHSHAYHLQAYHGNGTGSLVPVGAPQVVPAAAVQHLLTARCRKATAGWVYLGADGLWYTTTQASVTAMCMGRPPATLPIVNAGILPAWVVQALGIQL
jgi:hypothetical protein